MSDQPAELAGQFVVPIFDWLASLILYSSAAGQPWNITLH